MPLWLETSAHEQPLARSWLKPKDLQRASTRCALLGSGAALLGSTLPGVDADRAGQASYSHLEIAALVLICGSLGLELTAFFQRRQAETKELGKESGELPAMDSTSGQAGGAESKTAPANSRPQLLAALLRLLGPLALAMGCCTALGASAAHRLGIMPRTVEGLPGVVFGCFVHLSWPHCGWNALALVLLGPCVLLAVSASDGISKFFAASAFISLTSGFCVWCLARPALHAGASGLVCGYLGLLLALLLRRRDLPLGTLLMVLGVVACYSSALLFHRPAAGNHGRLSLYEACTSQSTSAEHHTFGFLSGLASVLFFCRPGQSPRFGPRAGEEAS
eukprot:TRINITY_DN14238_c0_g1_i1.p1 TRINITY_DN14238_c0_g1~~TRINITY_DN14238_c0_g1_i1.p1  ORF type:complete len:335 (+),score=46.11 TRINITY_DN14238_c0_g1_i1:90-1094(+)